MEQIEKKSITSLWKFSIDQTDHTDETHSFFEEQEGETEMKGEIINVKITMWIFKLNN